MLPVIYKVLFECVLSMVSSFKVIHFIIFWSLVILGTTDGGSVTWSEPPPVETTSDDKIELTADSRQLHEGSTNVQLSWNFSLTSDLNLITVDITLNGEKVATVVPSSGNAGPATGFEGRYNVTGTPQRVTLIIFNVTEDDDGEFACELNTFEGAQNKIWARKMKVEVVAESSFTSSPSGDQNIREGSNLTLSCDATGKPNPNITWTRVLKNGSDGDVVFFGNPWFIVNISRTATGTYRCTAYNGIGNPVNHSLYINVTYPPVDYREDYTIDVLEGQSKKIDCEVRGNPPPIITWYKGNDTSGTMINTSATLMFTETVFNDSGWYSCFAENFLGNLTVTVHLRVGKPSTPITSTEPMTEVVKVTKFLIKMTITNKNCDNDNPSDICEEISKEVKRIIQGNGSEEKLKDVKVENCGCGSITAYLSLDFKQSVEIPNVISVLKEAAKKGNGFGDLKVDLGSIQEISDDQLPSSTQRPSSTEESTTSGDDDNKEIPWIIIGASAGGAIVLLVIVVVAWCVHHKRKCRRKGSKVRCSESEEQAFTPREDNDHGHVNNGYAEAGPRPTAMVDMSQHQGASVAPTYAVVDKSAKKGKMKDKKDEEKKPQTEPPQYSVVDKSKKKKKKKEEEPEATYAQVDMSKKSKKKAKPGEVLYADLGDFHQMQELPNVSTSPKALPPIKKPAPYVETQYADITQFLKGDVTLPDSNNSQGPAPGTQAAPVPENQESQEPGTSAKETSQASNPGGDGGPGHETNF